MKLLSHPPHLTLLNLQILSLGGRIMAPQRSPGPDPGNLWICYIMG